QARLRKARHLRAERAVRDCAAADGFAQPALRAGRPVPIHGDRRVGRTGLCSPERPEGNAVSTAPRIDIDPADFWTDPYPMLARFRKEAPIVFVPQLSSTLLCSRDDIFVSEKRIDVFSSHQPQGLMNRLMGHNMLRKDGDAHMNERKAIFPAISP